MAVRVLLIALLTAAALPASAAGAAVGSWSIDPARGHEARASAHRATVTATVMTLTSGRQRVSVRSDAPRVKLTYRTATRRLRSKTVIVRDGVGQASVAAGSRSLTARALGTSRRRGSAGVRVRRNPLLRDSDGDGIPDHQYDLDTDGRYELVLFDADRNGGFESLFLDTGAASGLFRDQNQDAYFELLALDANRDGRAEQLFYDGDRDGYPELQCLDYIGPDGAADTWVETRLTAGTPAQDRAASDVMVKNIVTLNQLRQLNPASTGFIPYNPAPSLLR